MRGLLTPEARTPSVLCSLRLVASVLALIGFFGPWVPHETAALTVIGYQMSEFAKFFPQVQGSVVPVVRALFVTPLLSAMISAAFVTGRSNMRSAFRVSATVVAGPLCLAVLPPHQSILEPVYRLQLIIVGVAMVLVGATLLTRRLSERVRGILTLVTALVGAVPALWQYMLFRPLVVDLYQASVPPGWGLIVCGTGFILLLGLALRDILTS